jgi:hypothetical protein
LAFYELIAGLGPEQNVLVLIVEDIVAIVGRHCQHGMTFVLFATVISNASRGQPDRISMRRLSKT